MKKCTTYTLGKTSILKEADDFNDFSDMGEYTDKLTDGVIVRECHEFYERIKTEMDRDDDGRFCGKKEPGPFCRYSNEYRGFKPGNHIPYDSNDWSHVSKKNKSEVIKQYGSLKSASYAYAMADYERMESYNNGNWQYVFVVVSTSISTDTGLTDKVFNSLGGIESDSGFDHFKEIIDDLKIQNKQELLKRGFSESEINKSLDNAEEVE